MYTRTFNRTPFAVFNADSGAGAGGSGQDPAAGEKPQAGNNDGGNAGNGGSGTPDNPTTPPAGEEENDTAKRLEALEKELKETRKEAANYRTQLRKLEETAQAAEEQKLKEQGEFKTLAEQYEAKVKELEPKAKDLESRLQAFEQRETKAITDAVKDWPDNLKALVDKAGTIEEKRVVLDSLKPTVEALTKGSQAPGTGPGPKPAGQKTDKVTPSRPVRL